MKRLIALLFSVLMVCAGNFALASTAANPPTQQPRTSQKSSNKQTPQKESEEVKKDKAKKQKELKNLINNSNPEFLDPSVKEYNKKNTENMHYQGQDASTTMANYKGRPTMSAPFRRFKSAYDKANKRNIVGWWRKNFNTIKKDFENDSTSIDEKKEIIKIANSVIDSAKNQRNETFKSVVEQNTGLTKSISSNFIDNNESTVIANKIASVYQKKNNEPVTDIQYNTIVNAADEAKNDETVQDLENKLGELCDFCPKCCQEAQKGNSATSPQQ